MKTRSASQIQKAKRKTELKAEAKIIAKANVKSKRQENGAKSQPNAITRIEKKGVASTCRNPCAEFKIAKTHRDCQNVAPAEF